MLALCAAGGAVGGIALAFVLSTVSSVTGLPLHAANEELMSIEGFSPLGMALFAIRNRPVWDLLMAGGVLATIPMLITFVFFQRNMIRGIVLGGVKG